MKMALKSEGHNCGAGCSVMKEMEMGCLTWNGKYGESTKLPKTDGFLSVEFIEVAERVISILCTSMCGVESA